METSKLFLIVTLLLSKVKEKIKMVKSKINKTLKSNKYKICEKCEAKVLSNADLCNKCGGKKFRPSFIEKRVNITKNFSINVIPNFVNKKEKVLNLYKWFPGKNPWKININSGGDWYRIVKIVENQLFPILGWESKNQLNKVIYQAVKNPPSDKAEINKLTQSYPKIFTKIIKTLDFENIEEQNHKYVLDALVSIGKVFSKSDQAFLVSFKNIVKSLPKQEKLALEQLEDLLKDLSLKQITGVTKIVKERLNEISGFEIAIGKDTTFEIKGGNSIHRILERAMWIIDERYWLLHSNESLRKIVGDEIVKKNKKDEKKRPDFVCGSIGDKLIIVELKRPSCKLKVEDLNQVENYLKLIESFSQTFKKFEAYLIGKRIDDDLLKTMKYRKSIFKIKTYADMINDTKIRYKEYLKYQ